MNQRIREMLARCTQESIDGPFANPYVDQEKFAELIVEDMHRKVIASILITNVVMEEKGLTPTSEDYIHAINKDFGVKE